MGDSFASSKNFMTHTGLAFFHNGSTNMLFLDGHVAAVKRGDLPAASSDSLAWTGWKDAPNK
jgi:prepilin-type processing-associated H-X9-DG protein